MPVLLPNVYSQLDTLGGTAIGALGRLSVTVVGRGDRPVSPVFIRSISRYDSGSATGFDDLVGLPQPDAPTVTPATAGGGASWGYRIVALNALGNSIASLEGTTGDGQSNITTPGAENLLSWPAVPGALSYDVYRTDAAVTPSTTGFIGNTSDTNFTDDGSVAGGSEDPTLLLDTSGTFPKTYYYVVTAVNATGETIQSNEVSVAVSTANDKVTLVWDAITGVGVTGYRIWRHHASGAGDYPAAYDNNYIATVSGELSTTYVDTGVPVQSASFPTSNTALRVPLNTFRTFTSMTDMRSAFGSLNSLGIAAQIAQRMGLTTLSAVSVDFSGVDAAVGDPAKLTAKQSAYETALNVLLNHDTDIVVLLDPEPEISLKGKAHVNLASDLVNRKERMLFCAGGLNDTIGDAATEGTLVYNAVNSFNDRLVAAWAPVAPHAIVLNDSSVASEIALDGAYTALAAAVLNAIQADEATPITNKSFSAFTRFDKEFNRADLQILDPAGVSVVQTDANGQSTVVHGITTATDTVENSEINVVLQENTLLRELRAVNAFAIGQKNSEQVRLAVHDKTAQLLQLRVSQGLMTDFSGLEVKQDRSRPTYILVNFLHTPMFGVNVVFISMAFDTRGGVGNT